MTQLILIVLGASLCLTLTGAWGAALGAAPRLLGLKRFEDRAAGTADLLPYAALVDCEPSIVMTKAGGLLAGWFYQGPDVDSATDDERNDISRRINAALLRLGSGYVTWHDALRIPVQPYCDRNVCHFPDALSLTLDEERRRHFLAQGRHFQSEHVLVLMYVPPTQKTSKFIDSLYDKDDNSSRDSHIKQTLSQFKKTMAELEDALGTVVHIRPMCSYWLDEDGILDPAEDAQRTSRAALQDELVNYLNLTLTGTPTPVNIPPVPMYLDAILAVNDLAVGDRPLLGKNYIACVSISGFPHATYPNILKDLESLPSAYRWSTRMIYLDQHQALGELNKYRRMWDQRKTGFISQMFRTPNPQINKDALQMVLETDAAIADANSDLVGFGYYSTAIVLMNEDLDELEKHARSVAALINRRGFMARIETLNTMEAWLGTLPGLARPNVRRPFLHTKSLADLLPLSQVWAGEEANPCPFYPPASPPWMYVSSSGSTPFRLNLHHGDLGHTLILGPTGAGKSTLLASLAWQFLRYNGATITAFDKGRSLFALATALPIAAHYDIAQESGDGVRLCPLADLDNDGDEAWAEDWLQSCYQLQNANQPPSAQQKEQIHQAVRLLRTKERSQRTITDFLYTVQDQKVQEAIGRYAGETAGGRLLDHSDNSVSECAFAVYECEELMGLGVQYALPVLLYLFRRFERSLKGQPAALLIDEAWMMLKDPVFQPKIREWLKVLRKQNCVVILATQSLSDLLESGIVDVLQESCPTKIMLPNNEAEQSGSKEHPGPREMYLRFGCSAADIGIIKNATKKREYYYMSNDGKRLFDLSLGALELSFVGVSDKESIAAIRNLIATYGRQWPQYWLKQRGVPDDSLRYLDEALAA